MIPIILYSPRLVNLADECVFPPKNTGLGTVVLLFGCLHTKCEKTWVDEGSVSKG